MRMRPLFRGGPEVSVIGLSLSSPPTASLPLNQLAMLAPDSEDPAASGEDALGATIRKAIGLGVNLLDTDWITANGHAQEVLGRTLETMDRASLIVTTKAGPRLSFHGDLTLDNSRANLMNQVHDSLFRLKLKRVDLLQVHWPDDTPPEQTAKGLQDAQHGELASWAGVCNHSLVQIKSLADHLPIQTVQAPLNILNRKESHELLTWCRAEGVGFLAADPLLSGLLTGKFNGDEEFADHDRDRFFAQPTFGKAVAFAKVLEEIAGNQGLTPAQLCVGWCLAQNGVTSVLCPAVPPDEFEQLVSMSNNPLDGSTLSAINDLAIEHGLSDEE